MAKPCAFEGQPLLDHMKGVEEIVKRKFLSDGYDLVVNKRMGRNDGRDLIILSSILHDIGKADEKYQNQFDEACNAVEKFSFKDHEVISSAYALKAGLDPYIAMAILLHHHAMRIPDEKVINSMGGAKIYMTEELCNYLKSHGVECIDSISREEIRAVMYLPKKVKPQFVSLLELPLVVSDNLDSQRRGDDSDRRAFISELKKLYG